MIPVHNEASNLPRLMAEMQASLPALAPELEIVLVDDGSTDGGAEVARRALGELGQHLRVVRHQVKSGYGVSVADGLRAARGDFVAFIDGDGQFDPGDLHLLARALEGHDLVAGIRARRADPFFRSVISGVFNVLVRLTYGISKRDVDCGLKIMSRDFLASAFPLQARSALLNTELFFKAKKGGWGVYQVQVTHRPRLAGVRSGARLRPILRAVKELVLLRLKLARTWSPDRRAVTA